MFPTLLLARDLFPVQANVCNASRRIMVVKGKRGHLLFGFKTQN